MGNIISNIAPSERWGRPVIDKHSKEDILSQMQLLYGPPELTYPRNVALMLFTDNPEKYFPYTKVEIVIFPNGADHTEFFEVPAIFGPVPSQIRQTLLYLKTVLLKEKISKIPGQAESVKVWNYPYQALEEIIANSLYHRDYQTREPVEIRIYPTEMIILNYGGPDRSIKASAFNKGTVLPRRYRNRRLGDFLKELDLTEGKATGIPMIKKAMQQNGSPDPDFETDDERSYFQVTLKIHPGFLPENNVSTSLEITEGAKNSPTTSNYAIYVDIKVIEGAIEGVSTRLKDKLGKTLKAIIENEHKRIPEYVKLTGYTAKTLERYIKQLKDAGLIDFTDGGTKTGGYLITELLKKELKTK